MFADYNEAYTFQKNLMTDKFSQTKYSPGTAGGQITYGAVDKTNCDSSVNYVPLIDDSGWTFVVDK